jgi:hypothetical protein
LTVKSPAKAKAENRMVVHDAEPDQIAAPIVTTVLTNVGLR